MQLGTPDSASATRILFLGAGELGKEVVLEMMRLGVETIAVDRYPNAPGMQVAHRFSQDLSEFALHARAVLGLPIPNIAFHGPSASKAIVVDGNSNRVAFGNLEKVLEKPNTSIRLFGKPECKGHRRMGVLLARAASTEEALETVEIMREQLAVEM